MCDILLGVKKNTAVHAMDGLTKYDFIQELRLITETNTTFRSHIQMTSNLHNAPSLAPNI